MPNLIDLCYVYGPLFVIAGVFLYTYLKDRSTCQKERAEFIELTTIFTTTVANHMEHETQAVNELTRAIDRLCVRLEMPNRDYTK